MTILLGKTTVKCPKTGTEVVVHEVCVNCDQFNHIGLQGYRIYVSCGQAQGNEEKP